VHQHGFQFGDILAVPQLANRQAFGDARQVDTIWTTFQVSLPATLFSVAVSVPLAYFVRRGIKFERLITTILILPLTLGTVMVAQAMLSYFGPRGWFNQVLEATGLIQDPVRLIRNWLGVEIALFIQGFPFVFLMITGYMSGISPDLEKASPQLRSLVTSLEPGRISGIIKTEEGYRILKVLSKEPAGQRDLNDPRVQTNIRETLRNSKDQLLKAAYTEAARNNAEVKNYLAERIIESGK
jgi:hypothetical protein